MKKPKRALITDENLIRRADGWGGTAGFFAGDEEKLADALDELEAAEKESDENTIWI